mgnify:CR=1 FL=1
MMQFIEEYALSNNIYSIKADTNHDNIPMLSIFKKLGYTLCGTVYFRNSPRKAFEKVLKNLNINFFCYYKYMGKPRNSTYCLLIICYLFL